MARLAETAAGASTGSAVGLPLPQFSPNTSLAVRLMAYRLKMRRWENTVWKADGTMRTRSLNAGRAVGVSVRAASSSLKNRRKPEAEFGRFDV